MDGFCHRLFATIVPALIQVWFSFHRSEAAELVGKRCDAQEAALALGPYAEMAVVTDGANGSCISALGHMHVRARRPAPDHP